MLTSLAIRDIVLIERLDLEFAAGLCVLTGETGAGKSILIDALNLALGDRADTSVIRHGAEKAEISADRVGLLARTRERGAAARSPECGPSGASRSGSRIPGAR